MLAVARNSSRQFGTTAARIFGVVQEYSLFEVKAPNCNGKSTSDKRVNTGADVKRDFEDSKHHMNIKFNNV